MEKSKKASFSEQPNDERNVIGGCPWWIFGDENSADNDLKEKFEVVDEENQDNT